MHKIYKITNTVNGKIYVGKTSETVEKRWERHIWFSRKDRNIYFSSAIRKYGRDAFKHEVLAHADSDEQSCFLERMWILVLNSANREVGYNSTHGGEGFSTGDKNPNRMNPKRGKDSPSYGRIVTEEQRAKISATLTGKLVGEKNPFYGKQHTPEMIAFFRDSQKGKKTKPPSDETRDKIRQRMIGRTFSPETREKMRQAKLGKKQTPEHIANAAEARRKYPVAA